MPNAKSLFATFLSVLIGALGGGIALSLSAPMPYLIGAFVASTFASVSGVRFLGVRPNLPMSLRNLFVAVIGVMIGGSFRPGIFENFEQLYIPLLGVVVFVFVALSFNYILFRRVGRYDRVTAFYAAMPGGLIESVALGEKAGGNVEVLSLQQFSRIALVISGLPFLFLFFTGETVGSAAGVTLAGSHQTIGFADWIVLLACGLLGLYGGKAIRLPAAILVGPLVLSGAAHYFGLTQAGLPNWFISCAQVIVGAGLGARFSGFKPKQISRAISLAVISVAGMLVLDAGLVILLKLIISEPFDVLFISFAPGGVTETALIALSLNANPVFVTTLHVFRIIVTVAICAVSSRVMARVG